MKKKTYKLKLTIDEAEEVLTALEANPTTISYPIVQKFSKQFFKRFNKQRNKR